MSVTFSEMWTSPIGERGNNATSEVVYLATGSDDLQEILDEAETELPETFDGVGNRRIVATRLETDSAFWRVQARYSVSAGSRPIPRPPGVGESRYSFEIQTQNQKITNSFATITSTAKTGDTAPSFSTAINVTADGVQGVDILIPTASFSETHYLDDEDVTPTYQRTLEELVGTVNDGTFRGRAAGEVLFIGVSGGKRETDDVWEVTFRFAREQNRTNIVIGDLEPIAAKQGWDLLWAYYEPVLEEERIVMRPRYAYVERVYLRSNFASLGIGTT